MSVWQTIEGFVRALQAHIEKPEMDVPKIRTILSDLFDVASRERQARTLRAYTKEDLAEALPHLAFDVAHFRCYMQLDDSKVLWEICPAAGQAVRYGCLLHLRLLLGFFFGPPKEDDCWVGHFRELLPDFQTKFPSITSPTSEEARSLSKDLHKRLAHLTATRWLDNPAPPLPRYDAFYPAINQSIDNFTGALPDGLRTLFLNELTLKGGMHPPLVRLDVAERLARERQPN